MLNEAWSQMTVPRLDFWSVRAVRDDVMRFE
jgi:hypothetical protein